MQEDIFKICIEEAQKAYDCDDVPIGAVLINNNAIVAKGYNNRESLHNVMGHAEINVILEASKKLGRWNLSDCDLYVTLKPCSMCLEVIKQARIKNVYYLLDKPLYKKEYDKTVVTKINYVNEHTYVKMLTDFFQNKR